MYDELIAEITPFPSYVLIPEYGKRKAITLRTFLNAILSTINNEQACNKLGISRSTFLKYFKIFCSDKLLGRLTFKSKLLLYTSAKECTACLSIKPKYEFGVDKYSLDLLDTRCKVCSLARSKLRDKESHLASVKRWRNNNLGQYKAILASRRARKIQAIPKWANMAEIAKIYITCPKGSHVDHIIPLNGKNVCGLHVENNLRHLDAVENMKKSNKFNDLDIR